MLLLCGKPAKKKKKKRKFWGKTALRLTSLELRCDSFWAARGGRGKKQLSLHYLFHGERQHSVLSSHQIRCFSFLLYRHTHRNATCAVSLSRLCVHQVFATVNILDSRKIPILQGENSSSLVLHESPTGLVKTKTPFVCMCKYVLQKYTI